MISVIARARYNVHIDAFFRFRLTFFPIVKKYLPIPGAEFLMIFDPQIVATARDGDAKGILTGDTVHLSPLGNKLVANESGRAIAAALRARK